MPKALEIRFLDLFSLKNLLLFFMIFLLLSPVSADEGVVVRESGLEYAKPLEVIMVDGPLYVDQHPYHVADYIKPDSSVSASLVFDPISMKFISDPELIRKVLATKDLKKLTLDRNSLKI
jgi:hypothetical protein